MICRQKITITHSDLDFDRMIWINGDEGVMIYNTLKYESENIYGKYEKARKRFADTISSLKHKVTLRQGYVKRLGYSRQYTSV